MLSRSNFLLVLSLIAAVSTAAMTWYGVEASLYWYYSWWDIPTHILGGFAIGLWATAVAVRHHLSPLQAFLFVIGIALVVAFLWERWEYIEGLTKGEPGYWFDTIKDSIDDCIGAFCALCIALRSLHTHG